MRWRDGALALSIAAATGFIACILLANYATTEYGMVPVGFGLAATAGTYFAGLTFVLRDTLQDGLGKAVTIAVIIVGAALSWLLAVTIFEADANHLPPGVTPASIALASGAAFLFAELVDLAIYTPLRRRGYVRAAIASNVVGAVVDTVLFLWVAGFPIVDAVAGQMVGKLAVTLAVVLVVAATRTRRVVRA